MKLVEATLAAVCLGLAAGCVETTYAAGDLDDPLASRAVLFDPVASKPLDAVAAPADATGEWRWIDGAWRWIARTTVPQRVAYPSAAGSERVVVRVRVSASANAALREGASAAFDVTAIAPPGGTVPDVTARFSASVSDANARLAEPIGVAATRTPLEPTRDVEGTVVASAPMPAVTLPPVSTGIPRGARVPSPIASTDDAGAIAASQRGLAVTAIGGPEEIRSAPAAGEIANASNGSDVAITVVPMRTSGARVRRSVARGF